MRNISIITLFLSVVTLCAGSVFADEPDIEPRIGFMTIYEEPDSVFVGSMEAEEVVEAVDSVEVDSVAVEGEGPMDALIAAIDDTELFTECNQEIFESLSTETLMDLYDNDTLDACGEYVLGLRLLQNSNNKSGTYLGTGIITDSAMKGYTKSITLLGTMLIAADDADEEMVRAGAELIVRAALAGDAEATEMLNVLLKDVDENELK